MFNQKKITFETNYNDLPLSTTDKNFQGFNTEILDAIIRVMDNSLERTSQSQFMLFRISFPIRGNANQKDEIILPDAELPQGNEVFTYFLNQYIRHLKHVRFAPLYVWGREQTGTCDHCHYHLALWLDRNKIRCFGSLEQIDCYWSHALANFGIVAHGANTAGLIDRGRYKQDGVIQYYGMTVHRGNQKEYEAVFQRASYIAKMYSKDAPWSPRTRSWGCSQI